MYLHYRADSTMGTARRYVGPCTRSRFPCRTERELETLCPNGDLLIVGKIGGSRTLFADGDMLLMSEGAAIPIRPWGSLVRSFEWVAGYVPMKEKAYAATVESLP